MFDRLGAVPSGRGGTGRVWCGLVGLDPGIGGGGLLALFSEMAVCGKVGESCKGWVGIGGGDRGSPALGRVSRVGIGGGGPLLVGNGISSSDSELGVDDSAFATPVAVSTAKISKAFTKKLG